jgi:hypothetical protein
MANEYLNFPEPPELNLEGRFNQFISAPLNLNSAKPFLFFPFAGQGSNAEFEFDFERLVDGSDANSYLGTPIFDQIILGAEENNNTQDKEGVTYFNADINGNVTEQPVIINNGLITVRQGRNIIKTALVNASGTVKEFISDNDFEITIIGAIEHSDADTARTSADARPDREIQNFIRLCKVSKEIPVSSRYLNDLFGVTELVIEGYELGQKSGQRGLQFFSLTCISDTAKIIRQNREDISE